MMFRRNSIKKLFITVSLVLFSPVLHSAPEIRQDTVKLLMPKLNSDRIAQFFGSYGIEPIPGVSSPFGECRITNLHSIQNDQKIMRTLAVVEFRQPVHEQLQKVHEEICGGGSIGITLRKNGWAITKLPVYFGSTYLSPQLQSWMHEDNEDQGSVYVYRLNVSRGDGEKPIHYCTIIEVYSPQYLNEAWLYSLYPDQYKQYRETSGEIDRLLDSLRVLIEDFPISKNY